MSDSLLYGFKLSLQHMKTLKIVIDIANEDRKWKCFHKTNITWWDKMVCMST
jgi:hypothetical protein